MTSLTICFSNKGEMRTNPEFYYAEVLYYMKLFSCDSIQKILNFPLNYNKIRVGTLFSHGN